MVFFCVLTKSVLPDLSGSELFHGKAIETFAVITGYQRGGRPKEKPGINKEAVLIGMTNGCEILSGAILILDF